MHGVNLVCRGSVTAAFAVPAEHQERAANEIFYVPFRYIFVVRVIDKFAKRFVHRFVGMPRNENVNSLKPVSRSVIDKVLRFVIYAKDITERSADVPAVRLVTNADIHERTRATVTFFYAEDAHKVIIREERCFPRHAVIVIAID